jgi:3'(2'), 5'-bisphosphate nucleotidase
MISAQLVSDLISLVKQAGRIILQLYETQGTGLTTESQISAAAPVTAADVAAHRFIVGSLHLLSPLLPVISEEADIPLYEERQKWPAFWIVDPLDGTKEFISQNGEFTVNLALVTGCRPVLGIVHSPVLDLTYHALLGKGAFRQNGDRTPIRVSVTDRGNGSPRIVTSRSHPGKLLEGFLSQVGSFELIKMGSSLKFCLVADGSAHLYPRLGPTMEWDTAAGQCIVEAAGGQVTTVEGTPLVYNKKDLSNPDFIVSSGGPDWWGEYLRRVYLST